MRHGRHVFQEQEDKKMIKKWINANEETKTIKKWNDFSFSFHSYLVDKRKRMKISTVKINGHSVKIIKDWNDYWCDFTWAYYSKRDGRWRQTNCRTKIDLIWALEQGEDEFRA